AVGERAGAAGVAAGALRGDGAVDAAEVTRPFPQVDASSDAGCGGSRTDCADAVWFGEWFAVREYRRSDAAVIRIRLQFVRFPAVGEGSAVRQIPPPDRVRGGDDGCSMRLNANPYQPSAAQASIASCSCAAATQRSRARRLRTS